MLAGLNEINPSYIRKLLYITLSDSLGYYYIFFSLKQNLIKVKFYSIDYLEKLNIISII
jgi:hypothetical protein